MEVEVLDPRTIGGVRGAAANSYNTGVLCAKVSRYAERQHHPDRLSQPLRRTGEKGDPAGFQPITWDQALELTAEAMVQAEQKHGPEAVWPYYYAGTMGLVQRDGINRLRHAKGYSREYQTICNTLSDAGWFAGVGAKWGPDFREVEHSDVIVVWGANVVHTQVHVMTHIARARKGRGAKLVVVDPYRNATAQAADIHLMPRPGTDGALAVAVMHVLFAEGLADRDYMAEYADCPDRLEAHVAQRPPEWAEAITGIPAEDIRSFARLYGGTRRSYIRCGYGFTRTRNGAAQMHAVSCLPTVTGAWAVEGGGAMYALGGLYDIDRTLIEGLDVMDRSVRNIDQSRIGPILTGDRAALKDGPPVTALFIQNTNPMAVAPESSLVARGFARTDLFTCVHEQFMTETAAMADIVLPATTFLEHDDLYIAAGHPHLMVAKAVVEPHGECRSNHDVLCALARLLGAEHRGFGMTAWDMVDETLRVSGYPDAETLHGMRWLDVSKDADTMHFRRSGSLGGFGFPDGRFRFAPDWTSAGLDGAQMPELPDHFDAVDRATAERPFRLVTAPARNFLNSSFSETATSRKREGRPEVLVHPQDLERLELASGDRVALGNDRGTVTLLAKAFEGLQPGVLVVESIWPAAAFEDGKGINTLVSAEPGPPKGGAVFHDTAVWLRAADALADGSDRTVATAAE